MKSLNKKISAIALTGMMIAGGSSLSQGFVAHANSTSTSTSTRRTLLHANMLKDHPQGSGYNYVEGHQYTSNYDAIYLGSSTKFNKYIKRIYPNGRGNILIIPQRDRNNCIPDYFGLVPNHKYFYLEYNNGFDFLNNMHKLNPYRTLKDPIVVKIENDYFGFFFNLTTKERNVLPVKQFIASYNFKVEYAHDTSSLNGISQMEAHIMDRISNRPDVNGNPEIVQKLLKTPNQNGVNVFSDIEHFAYDLNNNRITIPKGLSRYRIGNYDYIFEK